MGSFHTNRLRSDTTGSAPCNSRGINQNKWETET